MDAITMGLMGASILAALGTASWAGLKGWQGWLELKRFELTQGTAERVLPPASGRALRPAGRWSDL